ncbi:MAG: flagellar assembly peptidoglycan hydrolase FlgJ [Burkholderiaceae bacterium]
MINAANLAADDRLATDVKGFDALRAAARQQSPEALKATAKQFEGLFMNMVMKSMRDATPQDGVFDSQQSRMFTSMLDQQISQSMAERGVGLADVLIRQLSTLPGVKDADGKTVQDDGLPEGVRALIDAPDKAIDPASTMARKAARAASGASSAHRPAHVQAFTQRLAGQAEEASRSTGIPAKFMLAQAALESGWGKHEIRGPGGATSHNLFAIKAGKDWNGKTVDAVTTEYVNGRPQTRIEKFRAYDSYADAFRDYGRLLRSNPRYDAVLANAQDATGFARGLQRAGYATDPHYAAKLTRIIQQSLSA